MPVCFIRINGQSSFWWCKGLSERFSCNVLEKEAVSVLNCDPLSLS